MLSTRLGFPHKILQIFLIVICAIVPFLPGINAEFIQDDVVIIQENPYIRDLSNVALLFTQPYWRDRAQSDLYRPLTVLSYAIDGWLLGRDESGVPLARSVHINNILLHALNCIMLWLIVLGYFHIPLLALLAAIIFALHPLHAEAVVHMVGRADLLMTFFLLSAFYLQSRRLNQNTSAMRALLTGVCFLFSLLSKEMGVVLIPLLLAETLFLDSARGFVSHIKTRWYVYLMLTLSLLLFVLLRGFALSTPGGSFVLFGQSQYVAFPNPQRWEVLLTMTHAIAEYIRLMFVPIALSADYSGFPHILNINWQFFLSLNLILSLLCSAYGFWRKREGAALFWLCWFFICILPISNLLLMSGIIMAERAVYLPSVSAALALAYVCYSLWHKHFLGMAMAVLLCGSFAWQSYSRSVLWRSGRTIFEDAVAHGPYSGSIALSALCREYILLLPEFPELIKPAIALVRESVSLTTESTNVFQLADLLERDGQLEESFRWYSALWSALPDDQRAYDRLLSLMKKLYVEFLKTGQFSKARRLANYGVQFASQKGDAEGVSYWENLK